MKFIGRITAISVTLLSFIGWMFSEYTTYGKVRISLIMSILVYTPLTWWLGKQFDKARFYSEKDVLTGVYNRRFVDVVFPKLQAKADRSNTKLSVLSLDADRLKTINDLYGHKMGDAAIQHISNLLLNQVRNSDFVARWGGDEFLIVAPDTDQVSAQSFSERIKYELQARKMLEIDQSVSVSIGTATYPDDAQTFDCLLRVADDRMYEQKNSRWTS